MKIAFNLILRTRVHLFSPYSWMLPNSSGGIFDTVLTELPSSEQESDSIPSQSLTECGVTFQKPASSTAPAPAPVPTASTKQENNHDDNQNRFQTHSEVLLWAALVFEKFDRWRLEQSVQKRTQLNLTALARGEVLSGQLIRWCCNDPLSWQRLPEKRNFAKGTSRCPVIRVRPQLRFDRIRGLSERSFSHQQ
jgi:hypothetical protein